MAAVGGDRRELRDGMLTVRFHAADTGQTIALVGELDMANANTLADALEQAEAAPERPIVVDLGELEFIDSTGIALLVGAHRRLNADGEQIRFTRSRSTGVQRVIDVTGLERELPFVSN